MCHDPQIQFGPLAAKKSSNRAWGGGGRGAGTPFAFPDPPPPLPRRLALGGRLFLAPRGLLGAELLTGKTKASGVGRVESVWPLVLQLSKKKGERVRCSTTSYHTRQSEYS
jgi:hypothetical protein